MKNLSTLLKQIADHHLMRGLFCQEMGLILEKHGFIEGNTDEILEEVDWKVMEREVRRISDDNLETGLVGIAVYDIAVRIL